MNKPLKEVVKHYIQPKKLSTDQVDELMKMQQNALPVSVINSIKTKRYSGFSLFAIAALVIVSVVSGYLLNQMLVTQGLYKNIVDEIAVYHIKQQPLEIKTSDMEGIKRYFQLLDFSPIAPAVLMHSSTRLIGGRYCSIQGTSSAQLRLQNQQTNSVQTLYQIPYQAKLFDSMPIIEKGEKPVSLYARGVKVNFWVEKGMLFALANNE